MGNQYICVGRYGSVIMGLTVGNAIFHEHRDSIEFNSIYYYTGIT